MAAQSMTVPHHADFMIRSCSSRPDPRRERRSVATCLLDENKRSHGTEDA